jgi:hypothetical protein
VALGPLALGESPSRGILGREGIRIVWKTVIKPALEWIGHAETIHNILQAGNNDIFGTAM